jgi:hypothetical protein
MELLTSQVDAGARIEAAASLTARLPRTLAGLAAGSMDHPRRAHPRHHPHRLRSLTGSARKRRPPGGYGHDPHRLVFADLAELVVPVAALVGVPLG